jgi:hypothetical protein
MDVLLKLNLQVGAFSLVYCCDFCWDAMCTDMLLQPSLSKQHTLYLHGVSMVQLLVVVDASCGAAAAARLLHLRHGRAAQAQPAGVEKKFTILLCAFCARQSSEFLML